jgi:hypothetical protein
MGSTIECGSRNDDGESAHHAEPDPFCQECVLTGAYDRDEDHPLGPRLEQRSWCGKRPTGFAFTGPTHAALNGRNEGRLVACPACVTEIVKALRNGHEGER